MSTPPTYRLNVQAIRSGGQQPRLYVYFPLALAAAIGLRAGDEVEWELLDRAELHLVRVHPTLLAAKKRAAKRSASQRHSAGAVASK